MGGLGVIAAIGDFWWVLVAAWPVVAVIWMTVKSDVLGWRVKWVDYRVVRYSARNDGRWDFIEFAFEPRAPQVLVLGGAESWSNRPAWAQQQRETIIARLRRAFPRARLVEHGDV